MSEKSKIPTHVAIIMDGNGRWARRRGRERVFGHAEGVERLRGVVGAALRCGVRYLTLYAFSTENWGRPAAEVEAIMELFCKSVEAEAPELSRTGVRVSVIGEREHFARNVQQAIARIEEQTRGGEQLTLVLAFNYSSRREIVRAVRTLASEAAAGRLDPACVTERTLEAHLYTASIPDPDLVIRTSGEQRLSNFLLWQSAYAEFYFTEVLWPDFTEQEFCRALEAYASRERRYGLITNNRDLDLR